MLRLLICLLLVGIAVSPAVSAAAAEEKAVQKDRKRLEGRWRVVELVANGKEVKEGDAQKLVVINEADGLWRLLSEGKAISKGTSTIDPTKKPKTIDFTVTEGEGKGNQHLGIYELGEESRKLAFARADKGRPTEFASKPDSGQVLVKFERADEQQEAAASAESAVLTNADLVRINELFTAVDEYSDNEFLYDEKLNEAIEDVAEFKERPTRILVEVMHVGKEQVTVRFFAGMFTRVYPRVRLVEDGNADVEFRSAWYGGFEFGGIVKGGSRDGQLRVGRLVPTSLARELRRGDQLAIMGTLTDVLPADVSHPSLPDVVAGFVIVASSIDRASEDEGKSSSATSK